MFLLCDMNANAQQIIKSSDTNDFRIGDSNDTYYIYDDLGLLRFVLSPSYQEEANLEKYGYEYRYDQRGRCVWKRLPGCEYLQLWYDNADNLMFSQDGEQRKKGIYVFYLYDFVKRQVLQGTTTAINSSCPSAIVAFNVSDAGICRSGYSSANDLGLKKEQLLQANYYDNHAFINGQLEKQATSQNLVSNQQASEQYSKGSLTGTVCMATDGKPLVSVYYHDLRGQVIASKQTLPDDALLSQNMTYSFTKQPLEIISEIFKNGISTTVTQTNSYNKHNDKIETMTLKVGNVTRTVSSYSYNDISRLLSIKRSGNVLRGYDFANDGLNRLEESAYGEGADLSQSKSHYSEHVLSYSPNGSIERLQRYGKKNNGTFGLIDDLTYAYNGNQIKSISDKAGSLLYDGSFDFKDGADADVEYFYDANGALVKDLNKGICNIEYDILGNLKCITFSNGFKTKYIYDAAGYKLRTTHESAVTNTTDYIGNFIFEDGKLDKYLFDGGYCSFDNNQNPTFHYYEKDHLASVRMVVNENGTIEQVSHYYPFGGVYGDLSYNSELQRNKYVGKEFDHMYGLDWYDHGARMYDAARVVWDRIDNSGEKNSDISPYLYCHDNAINKFDPDGNDDYFSNSGQFLFSKGASPNIYVANGNNGFVNFNTLDLRRKNNLNTGVRIVGYYARKAGVKYNVNGGRGYVGISTLHRTDNQKDVLAQTKGESIYLKMSNGKLNKEMYNIYNLINTIGHEKLHKESDVTLNYLVHSQIVLKQLADANFSNGSEKYQTGTIGNMIVLMNEANKKEQSANALIQIMVKANSIIKPLGLGRIVRRNNHFEYVYGTK